MRVPLKSAIMLALATAFWAGHFVLAGVALDGMSPIVLTCLRWLLAALPLILVAQLTERPDWRAVLPHWPRLLLLAVLGMLGYNMLLYEALHYTDSIGASLINASNPALMALLAVFLAHERLRPLGVVGILVSFLGVVVVLTGGDFSSLLSLGFNPGHLLMLLAVLVWSLYTIWGRVPGVPPVTSTAVQAVFVVLLSLPLMPMLAHEFHPTASTWWSLVYIVVFPSFMSYLLWNRGVKDVPSSTAGIFLNLITVFVVLIGVLIGQRLTLADAFGGMIVILGVLITTGMRPRLATPDR